MSVHSSARSAPHDRCGTGRIELTVLNCVFVEKHATRPDATRSPPRNRPRTRTSERLASRECPLLRDDHAPTAAASCRRRSLCSDPSRCLFCPSRDRVQLENGMCPHSWCRSERTGTTGNDGVVSAFRRVIFTSKTGCHD